MQMHLDFDVDDLDSTEARVLAAGATRLRSEPGEHYRVFADPAGHPVLPIHLGLPRSGLTLAEAGAITTLHCRFAGAVARRMDSLDRDARLVITAAAVLGRRFE
jgi:hypothetical protein